MYDIKYDSKSETVQLIYPNGKTETLSDNAPTEPLKSADNKKAVYISPLEWEERGSLYLVNLETGKKEVLVEPDLMIDHIPKNVIWCNNDYVFTIIGYRHGTVAVGGNIYLVNVRTKERKPITTYDPYVQVTDIFIKDDFLSYKGIRYIDDTMNESRIYENNIPLARIFDKE
ncbi:DUF4652 domain-containing protein [Priestia aryabhattai]|uniref:DUF4652 domain-containing protein n=1 Tax=Priestia aryabhattai TaxID=412384 RepID=UPI003D2C616F